MHDRPAANTTATLIIASLESGRAAAVAERTLLSSTNAHLLYPQVQALASVVFKDNQIRNAKNFTHFVHAMWMVLETPHLDYVLRGYLDAVSSWIHQNGSYLRTCIEDYEEKLGPYHCGPMFQPVTDNDPAYRLADKQRWNWWRDRFVEITKDMEGTGHYHIARRMRPFEDI